MIKVIIEQLTICSKKKKPSDMIIISLIFLNFKIFVIKNTWLDGDTQWVIFWQAGYLLSLDVSWDIHQVKSKFSISLVAKSIGMSSSPQKDLLVIRKIKRKKD